MSTFAIMFGFAVMLFLPCAIALMVSRNADTMDASAYADRILDQIVRPQTSEMHALAAAEKAEAKITGRRMTAPTRALEEAEEWGDLSDPAAQGRGSRTQPGRVERAEMDVLKAWAVAIRAHAEALAAIARAATTKAEVAAEQAEEAEMDAEEAIQSAQRAA